MEKFQEYYVNVFPTPNEQVPFSEELLLYLFIALLISQWGYYLQDGQTLVL